MPEEKITREKIIHAVLECAFVNSVGATSLADIAGKLGIKKASLYNHYESREAMIDDTIRYCGESLSKISFIPAEMDATAQKYAAEAVLKGIVHRWFKVNEKEPLVQIYSFVESEKYFSTEAASIYSNVKNKLSEQTVTALKSLAAAGKIKNSTDEDFKAKAEVFSALTGSLLDNYIVEKKMDIRSNPQTGEGELFTSLPFEPDYNFVDSLVEQYCKILAI